MRMGGDSMSKNPLISQNAFRRFLARIPRAQISWKEIAVAWSKKQIKAKKPTNITEQGLNFIVNDVLLNKINNFEWKIEVRKYRFSEPKNEVKMQFFRFFSLQLINFCRNLSFLNKLCLSKVEQFTRAEFKTITRVKRFLWGKIWFFDWAPFFTGGFGRRRSQSVKQKIIFFNFFQLLV